MFGSGFPKQVEVSNLTKNKHQSKQSIEKFKEVKCGLNDIGVDSIDSIGDGGAPGAGSPPASPPRPCVGGMHPIPLWNEICVLVSSFDLHFRTKQLCSVRIFDKKK